MDTDRTDLRTWLRDISGGEPDAVIARKIGVPQRTFANHVKTGELRSSEIVAIARAYARNPIYALRDHGLITDDEIAQVSEEQAAYDMPMFTLVDSLRRRIGGLGIGIDVLDDAVRELGPAALKPLADNMRDDVISAADLARVKAEQAEAARAVLAEAALNQEGDSPTPSRPLPPAPDTAMLGTGAGSTTGPDEPPAPVVPFPDLAIYDPLRDAALDPGYDPSMEYEQPGPDWDNIP